MNHSGSLMHGVAALVDRLRTSSESIWSWHTHDNFHVSVQLIDASKMEQAKQMEAFGLAGGEGRSLKFTKINGQWIHAGESRWIG